MTWPPSDLRPICVRSDNYCDNPYPVDVAWGLWQPIGRAADHSGLAARPAAGVPVNDVVGEEVAYFAAQPALNEIERKPFGNGIQIRIPREKHAPF